MQIPNITLLHVHIGKIIVEWGQIEFEFRSSISYTLGKFDRDFSKLPRTGFNELATLWRDTMIHHANSKKLRKRISEMYVRSSRAREMRDHIVHGFFLPSHKGPDEIVFGLSTPSKKDLREYATRCAKLFREITGGGIDNRRIAHDWAKGLHLIEQPYDINQLSDMAHKQLPKLRQEISLTYHMVRKKVNDDKIDEYFE